MLRCVWPARRGQQICLPCVRFGTGPPCLVACALCHGAWDVLVLLSAADGRCACAGARRGRLRVTGARTACAARRAACGLRDSTVEYHAQIVKPGGAFGDEHRETTDFQVVSLLYTGTAVRGTFSVWIWGDDSDDRARRLGRLADEPDRGTGSGASSMYDERFVCISLEFRNSCGKLHMASFFACPPPQTSPGTPPLPVKQPNRSCTPITSSFSYPQLTIIHINFF